MFLTDAFDNLITGQLREEEAVRTNNHKPSGKLSASMLGEPLQWQVLKSLGIGQRQVDDYTLRKFEVGRDTEDWFLKRTEQKVLERQKFVEYKGAIGYVDAIVSAEIGVIGGAITANIPLEVKSTSNAKFKRILQRGTPDENHMLQAAFYALALGSDYYAITYVATDDRRTHTWVLTTVDMQPKIEQVIDTYNAQMFIQTVPVFKANYDWQANPDYQKFPEWANLTESELKLAIDYHYPNAWENYVNAR